MGRHGPPVFQTSEHDFDAVTLPVLALVLFDGRLAAQAYCPIRVADAHALALRLGEAMLATDCWAKVIDEFRAD
jgi:hypothetical protein